MNIDVEELRAAIINYYGTGAVSTHYMAALDYVEKAKKLLQELYLRWLKKQEYCQKMLQ